MSKLLFTFVYILAFPALLLFLTYLGLLAQFPSDEKRLLWFIFASATFSLYCFLNLIKKKKSYSVEFFLSLALLIAGCVSLAVFLAIVGRALVSLLGKKRTA